MISSNSPVYTGYTSNVADLWLVPKVEQTWYTRYGKRLFDLLVALIVCVLILSWMIPVLGILICATSTGPVFFIQERTGRKGKIFRCLKFRSMYHAKDQTFKQAVQGDSRITPLGQTLRRTNLDEMPQFLNVLFGDMSVVGPRPHAVEHDNQYWAAIDNYHFRYSVRPGITGLAQTRGARGETPTALRMRHRLRYDLHYMKRQSLLLDVRLCWFTLKQMLSNEVNFW